jgi:hypothetical protein
MTYWDSSQIFSFSAVYSHVAAAFEDMDDNKQYLVVSRENCALIGRDTVKWSRDARASTLCGHKGMYGTAAASAYQLRRVVLP